MCPLSCIEIFFLISVECQVDRDCPFSKACVSHECIDPCLNKICGRNAECRVESHQAFCFCPNGLQGNPENFCIEVGCRTDSDCSFNEKCDRGQSSSQTRECQRLCLRNPCAVGASCSAQNHREICACNPPLTGDGYTECRERKYTLVKVWQPFLKNSRFKTI